MRHAYLGEAVLNGAYLGGADLEGATLRFAELHYTQLSQTNLRGADIAFADFRDAQFLTVELIMSCNNYKRPSTIKSSSNQLHFDKDHNEEIVKQMSDVEQYEWWNAYPDSRDWHNIAEEWKSLSAANWPSDNVLVSPDRYPRH